MAFDGPQDRLTHSRPLRVLVESGPGTGEFVTDPRLSLQSLFLGCDGEFSRAIIECFAGPLDSSTRGVEEALQVGDVLNAGYRPGYVRFITPDQLFMVARPRAGVAGDEEPGSVSELEMLFAGYCDKPAYEETNNEESTHRGFSFEVESNLKRLSDQRHAQIVGRRMRGADAFKALLEHLDAEPESVYEPFGGPEGIVTVPAAPCVFNAEGLGNRAATPIEVAVGDETIKVHVFADDHDPDAEIWTWAQALGYLWFWHLMARQSGASLDELAGLVADGNVWELLQTMVGDPVQKPLWQASSADRGAAPAPRAEAFSYAMLGSPRDFDCDGMSVPEALILLADKSGAHFRIKTEEQTSEGDGGETQYTGKPIDRIYFWARGAGDSKPDGHQGFLFQEATIADRGKDAEEILRKHNVTNLRLEVDYTDVIGDPVIYGSERRYEITVLLLPGWLPETTYWDINHGSQAAIDAAMEAARAHEEGLEPAELKLDPWYRRFCKAGAEFAGYADVGRRWVLRESGRYRKALYGRTSGPFLEAWYVPWEPSDASIRHPEVQADGSIATRHVAAGEWVYRGRPLEPCLTADAAKRSLGIVVELSWSAGAVDSWTRLTAGCRALEDEAGIYIDEADLLSIKQPGDEEMTYVEAYLRGLMRVRVTAVICGDGRVEPRLNVNRWGPAMASETSRIFDVSRRFRQNLREGGNSQYAPHLPDGTVNPAAIAHETEKAGDDLAELQRFGEGLLEVITTRQIAGAPVIPWITTEYEVGDSIREIRGCIELQTGTGETGRRDVDIVGIEYVGSSTALILDDYRLSRMTHPEVGAMLSGEELGGD